MINNLFSGNPNALIQTLLSIPVILIALTTHEWAHGYAAYKMGDPTARNLGRLTLNPLKHLDLFGTLCMFVAGFGWAKPVPINPRRFDNPRRGMAVTGLAGPLANIVLSFIGLLLFAICNKVFYTTGVIYQNRFAANLILALMLFLNLFHYLNLSLAIFNLIPVPPLDGSRIFFILLPDKWYFGIMKYEGIIQLILMLALFTGVLSVPLGFVMDYISRGMSFVIGLIPGL